MGGRGAFDTQTQSIPVENRKYIELDVINGVKVIFDFESKNGKTPVMSNTSDTVYAVYSENANRIKHIFFYENHILKKAIDLDGDKSHWHRVFVNEKGEIERKTHAPDNVFSLSQAQKEFIKPFIAWKRKSPK